MLKHYALSLVRKKKKKMREGWKKNTQRDTDTDTPRSFLFFSYVLGHSHLPYISNPRLSNPHIVATAFKRYFRELPGNLLSPEIVPKLVDALGTSMILMMVRRTFSS